MTIRYAFNPNITFANEYCQSRWQDGYISHRWIASIHSEIEYSSLVTSCKYVCSIGLILHYTKDGSISYSWYDGTNTDYVSKLE